jgi:hypothetical protein
MAAAGPRDQNEQIQKLLKALRGISSLVEEVLKEFHEAPPKREWNPILNKIKGGARINGEEFETIKDFLNPNKYEDNQAFNDAITSALRSMMGRYIKTQDHVPLVKSKIITVHEAMGHIEKISKMQNDSELLQYLSSADFLNWLSSK